MPYIQVSVSEKLDDMKIEALKAMLGKYIALLPGKSEAVLMVRVDDAKTMYFKGEPGKCAIIEVHLYKESPRDAKKAFASDVLKAFSDMTGVAIDRIFLNFKEYSDWAAGGTLL